MGTNNFVLSFTVLASALSDETPYKLVFNANANVLATVTPILRPVYEPGPSATTISVISVLFILLSVRISAISGMSCTE